ncbi:MAG: hypothetical protein ACK42A_01735 [Pyrinomonadaceae bacterium]|jgi:hypothetical protein
MRATGKFAIIGLVIGLMLSASAFAQAVNETYTGTLVSFGSGFNTRTRTTTFRLDIRGTTSDDELNSLTATLQEGGQDDLLKALSKNDLGRFAVGASVGRPLTAVRIDNVDGKKRIRAVFERWLNFTELRGGYRSVDYPFGYIELFIDPATGKGEGTLIEAAQIRWKKDKNTGEGTIEIENFATYPAKLMGVSLSGKR